MSSKRSGYMSSHQEVDLSTPVIVDTMEGV